MRGLKVLAVRLHGTSRSHRAAASMISEPVTISRAAPSRPGGTEGGSAFLVTVRVDPEVPAIGGHRRGRLDADRLPVVPSG